MALVTLGAGVGGDPGIGGKVGGAGIVPPPPIPPPPASAPYTPMRKTSGADSSLFTSRGMISSPTASTGGVLGATSGFMKVQQHLTSFVDTIHAAGGQTAYQGAAAGPMGPYVPPDIRPTPPPVVVPSGPLPPPQFIYPGGAGGPQQQQGPAAPPLLFGFTYKQVGIGAVVAVAAYLLLFRGKGGAAPVGG